MAANPPSEKQTHAELAAEIPAAPPDESNEAIIFAKKTLLITVLLAVGFIGSAYVYNFILQ